MVYIGVILELHFGFVAAGSVAHETKLFDEGFLEIGNWMGIVHNYLAGVAAVGGVLVLSFFVAALADRC